MAMLGYFKSGGGKSSPWTKKLSNLVELLAKIKDSHF